YHGGDILNLKEALEGELTEDEMDSLVTSFEVIGDIAMIEVPEELEHRKKLIGEKLLEINSHIRTVLRETSERKGVFRTRDYEVIAGDGNTETVHKEHGCEFKLDPTEVYFSEREATERQRIAEKVQDGEVIMAMFAGVGPFPVVIASQTDVERIYAVELNPEAYDYLVENVKRNRVWGKVDPIQGDVEEVCPEYYGKCDRVLMPLPKDSDEFLVTAVKCLKPEGGTVHYYTWSGEDNLYGSSLGRIEEVAGSLDKRFEVEDRRKVLSYAPGTWKVCLDVRFEDK
ncbi:MAG: class I SAM-dependent methyltransferase family protein, partial [Candidatus Aenigmatarchaeota archaeon]